ncbi:MAG: DUF885 domain-containing protein [Thermoanaerobaculia bacterium]|nr:DUF885 domain-containing protein [Thermoanaerobaculia bacterium]
MRFSRKVSAKPVAKYSWTLGTQSDIGSLPLVAMACLLFLLALGCGETAPSPGASAEGPPAAENTVIETADRYVAAYFDQFPTSATAEGIEGADHGRLPDLSPAALERWHQIEDSLLATLRSVDFETLDPATRTTAGFLLEQLEGSIDARVCRMELWNVSPTWTGWQSELGYIAGIQPVGTPAERDQAEQRARALGPYLEREIANLRLGLDLGYSAPKNNVVKVIDQMDGLRVGEALDSAFADPARRGDDEAFAQRMALAIEEVVDPAIAEYRRFLAEEYLLRARDAIAVRENTDGAECYRAAVRLHTSLQRSAEEIHQTGLEQMDRITAEMREIGERSFGTSDTTILLATALQDPRYTFSSREEVVNYAQAAIDRVRGLLPEWFGLLPKAEVVIVPYPAFREASAPGAEYMSASDDGSRPATYYINTYRPEEQSKAGVEATAFHEAYPGHHLQISIAKEQASGHPVQRYFGSSGFAEGWGLYSERLAAEMGAYGDDIDRLGLLSNEALRAGRLVVDSGMHMLGWTRQQAVDYLKEHTAESPSSIEAEVDRYLAVPGQATAYMLGNLEIRRLREAAESALGDDFEIRDFHDRVLEDGAVTLSMLGTKIDRWITEMSEPQEGEHP